MSLEKALILEIVRGAVQYTILNAHRTNIIDTELAPLIEVTAPEDIPAAMKKMLDNRIADAERTIALAAELKALAP